MNSDLLEHANGRNGTVLIILFLIPLLNKEVVE